MLFIHQDLSAMGNGSAAAHVNPLRLCSLTLPPVCKRQAVPCDTEIGCHKHLITAVINWQKERETPWRPAVINSFNNTKHKNYFDKALGSWCDCTTREAKSQEITCLVLPWHSPTLLASASYLHKVKPKSSPHLNSWGLSESRHATSDNWIFGSGCSESINVNIRSHRRSQLGSHQNEDLPFHNSLGKSFQVSSEIRIFPQ